MDKNEILQAAFNEGKKHIGKESDIIYSLAEEYVQTQPYEDMLQDDAIYEEFVKGATVSKIIQIKIERNKMKKKAVNKIRKSIKKCGLSKGGLVIDSNGSTTILGRFIIPLKSSD